MPEVVVTDEFRSWYEALLIDEQESVFRVVALLETRGKDRFYEQMVPRAEALWERYVREHSRERE